MSTADESGARATGSRGPRWRTFGRAALASLLVVAIAVTAFVRWDRAPVHGAELLVRRSTSDGVTVMVERGDVRWEHLFCADGRAQCTERTAGLHVTFELPDGRAGGATLRDSVESVPGAWTACAAQPDPPPAQIRTIAGLGIPPGSADEQFIVVRTTPEVGSVRALRPDGSVDETTPVDGTAVLATRTGFDTTVRVQAFDATGAALRIC